MQAAETRLRETTDAALKKLDEQRAHLLRLATSIEAAVSRHALDSEELAVEVAYAALVRVLGDAARERSLIPDLCRTIIREYGHPTATLRVSDADLPLLADTDVGVPVEADRRLSPGEAVIDTARGQFECGLDVRLAAIAEALSSTLDAHRSGMHLTGVASSLGSEVVDGHPLLGITNLSFDDQGVMQITYSSSEKRQGPRVALASFPNESQLELVGGRLIAGSSVQQRQIGRPGEGIFGKISGGSLELANVDLTQEFADMIIIQRGYQASSRVMTVSNQMIEELYNSTRGG